MATYSVKYYCDHSIVTNHHGLDIRIEILKKGYAGSATELLGDYDSGVFKHKYEDLDIDSIYDEPVQKSRLTFYPFIQDDNDLDVLKEIFNSDEDEYLMRKKVGGVVHWTGSVLPSMLSYPEDEYPYKGEIIAKDLTRLDQDYLPSGNLPKFDLSKNVITLIAEILNDLGYGIDLKVFTDWTSTELTANGGILDSAYANPYVLRDLGSLEKNDKAISKLDAVNYLLRPFGLTLSQKDNAWQLINIVALARASDLTNINCYRFAPNGDYYVNESNNLVTTLDNDSLFNMTGSMNDFKTPAKQISVDYEHNTLKTIRFPSTLKYTSSENVNSDVGYKNISNVITNLNEKIRIAIKGNATPTWSKYVPNNQQDAGIKLYLNVYDKNSPTDTTKSWFYDFKNNKWINNIIQGNATEYDKFATLYNNNSNCLIQKKFSHDDSEKKFDILAKNKKFGFVQTDIEIGAYFIIFSWLNDVNYLIPTAWEVTFNFEDISVTRQYSPSSNSFSWQVKQSGDYSQNKELGKSKYGVGPEGYTHGALYYKDTGVYKKLTNTFSAGSKSGMPPLKLLVSDFMDLQRKPLHDLGFNLWGLYNPVNIVKYNKKYFYLLGGTQRGNDYTWHDCSFIELTESHSADSFQKVINDKDTDSGGGGGVGGGATGGGTSSGSYTKEDADARFLNEADAGDLALLNGADIAGTALDWQNDALNVDLSYLNTNLDFLDVNDILGTQNQVEVTDNLDGTLTLGTPQDLDKNADFEVGTLKVNEGKFLSPTDFQFRNASDTAFQKAKFGRSVSAIQDDNLRYGYFNVYREDGTRGGYFGYGNGDDEVNIYLANATKLMIGGGDLHVLQDEYVNGNVILANQASNGQNPVRADRTLQITSGGAINVSNIAARDLTDDLSWNISVDYAEPIFLDGNNDLSVRTHNATYAGVIENSAQTIYGDKTFNAGLFAGDTTEADNFALVTDFAGTGWQATHAGDFNIRNLRVRHTAIFRELVINQLAAIGGSTLQSAARGKIKSVNGNQVTLEDYHDTGITQFAKGDLFMVREVDVDGGIFAFVAGIVTNVNGMTLTLSNADADLPAEDAGGNWGMLSALYEGAVMAQRGYYNPSDPKPQRQNAIYTTATDSDAPVTKYLSGLDSLTSFTKQSSFVGVYGNLDNIVDPNIDELDGSQSGVFGSYIDNAFLTGRYFQLSDFVKFDAQNQIAKIGNGNSYMKWTPQGLVQYGNLYQRPSQGSPSPMPLYQGLYSASTTYYKGDFVKIIVDGAPNMYILTGSDTSTGNNPITSGAWEAYSLSGEDGTSVKILGELNSTNDLPQSGNELGDGYIIGGDLYVCTALPHTFQNVGQIRGPKGEASYLHIGYSNQPDGTGFTNNPAQGGPYKYIGIAVNTTQNSNPSSKTAYDWSKYKGEKGAQGDIGLTGPSLLPIGSYSATDTYYYNNDRRDLVFHAGNWWLRSKKSAGTISGKEPSNTSQYWESFGTNVKSMATELFLADQATITQSLIMGTSNPNNPYAGSDGMLRTANFNYQDATGFKLQGSTGEAWFNKIHAYDGEFRGTVHVTGGNAATNTDVAGALGDAKDYSDGKVTDLGYNPAVNQSDSYSTYPDASIVRFSGNIPWTQNHGWEHYGNFTTYRTGQGAATQIVQKFAANKSYQRFFFNGSWSDWREIEDTAGAQAKADSARDAARNTLASKLGYADYADMVDEAQAGDTIIDGGFINNTLLQTSYIASNNNNFLLDLNAGKLAADTFELTTPNLGFSSSTKNFWINDSTFGNKGIQLEYNGGNPQAYIGDGTDFFQYDSNGVNISDKIKFQGGQAWFSDSVSVGNNNNVVIDPNGIPNYATKYNGTGNSYSNVPIIQNQNWQNDWNIVSIYNVQNDGVLTFNLDVELDVQGQTDVDIAFSVHDNDTGENKLVAYKTYSLPGTGTFTYPYSFSLVVESGQSLDIDVSQINELGRVHNLTLKNITSAEFEPKITITENNIYYSHQDDVIRTIGSGGTSISTVSGITSWSRISDKPIFDGDGLSMTNGVLNVDNPFNPNGSYTGLRAKSTTKADVGLGNVPNWSQTTFDNRYYQEGDRPTFGKVITAKSEGNNFYGFIEFLLNDNTRGGYIGYGNGGTELYLQLSNASKWNVRGNNNDILKVNGHTVWNEDIFDNPFPNGGDQAVGTGDNVQFAAGRFDGDLRVYDPASDNMQITSHSATDAKSVNALYWDNYDGNLLLGTYSDIPTAIKDHSDELFNNICIGFGTGKNLQHAKLYGSYPRGNLMVGANSGYNLQKGLNNTFLGSYIGYDVRRMLGSTLVGSLAGYKLKSSATTAPHENTVLGYSAGYSESYSWGGNLVYGAHNTLLGAWTGAINDSESNPIKSSIALGHGATVTNSYQLVVGSPNAGPNPDDQNYIEDVFFGRGIQSKDPRPELKIQTTSGDGTDIDATDLVLAGGQGTGAGLGGSVIVKTAPAGGSGSSKNGLAKRLEIDQNGNFKTNTGKFLDQSNNLFGNQLTLTGELTGTIADFSNSLSAQTVRTDTGKFLSPNNYQFKNAGDTGFRDVQMAGLYSATLGVNTTTLNGYTANINGSFWADKIHTAVLVADLFKKNEIQVMKSDFLFSDGTTTTAGYVGSSFELHVKEMVFDVNDQVVISWETPTGFTKDFVKITGKHTSGKYYDFTSVVFNASWPKEATAARVTDNYIFIDGDKSSIYGYTGVQNYGESPWGGSTKTPIWSITPDKITAENADIKGTIRGDTGYFKGDLDVGNVFSADASANTGKLAGSHFDGAHIWSSANGKSFKGAGYYADFANDQYSFGQHAWFDAGKLHATDATIAGHIEGNTGYFHGDLKSGNVFSTDVSANTATLAGFKASTNVFKSSGASWKTSGIYMNSSSERFSLGNHIWFESGSVAHLGDLDADGTITLTQAGGKLKFPPTFSGQTYNGQITNDGIELALNYNNGIGANAQEIIWRSALGTYAGKIKPTNEGHLGINSSFGIDIGTDFNSKISIGSEIFGDTNLYGINTMGCNGETYTFGAGNYNWQIGTGAIKDITSNDRDAHIEKISPQTGVDLPANTFFFVVNSSDKRFTFRDKHNAVGYAGNINCNNRANTQINRGGSAFLIKRNNEYYVMEL